MQDPFVHVVTGDQCMYGLTTKTENGQTAPARKSTTFLTSSRQLADLLGKRCDRSHTHQPLISGRCADAAFYPLKLIQTILQGMRLTKDAENAISQAKKDQREVINAIAAAASVIPPKEGSDVPFESEVPKVKGGKMHVKYEECNFRAKYTDEYTGETLEPQLIAEAIREELNDFNSRVWQVELKSEAEKNVDAIFVRSRWVLCNKGDNKSPDMRARLVACEINKGDKQDAFYASTPPLEAKKLLFSRLAQEKRRGKEPLRLSFLDVKKAYFNGIPRRDVYMSLPKELGLPSHFVAKQVRCVYGTRDAGAIWEDTYREALESIGFTSGVASPCCFFHKGRGLSVVVHGDDITTLGIDKDLTWLEQELGKSFELKNRGRIGIDQAGDNDIRILNRVAIVSDKGVSYEADPRHVDIILNSLGLSAANSVVTPGVKEADVDPDSVKNNEPAGAPMVGAPVTDAALDGTAVMDTAMVNAAMPMKIRAISDCAQCSNVPITATDSSMRIASLNHDVKSILKSSSSVRQGKINLTGTLHGKTEFHSVTPYAEIYGTHPSKIVACSHGFKYVSARADAFTGKLGDIMKVRMKNFGAVKNVAIVQKHRALVLQNQTCAFSPNLSQILDDHLPARSQPISKIIPGEHVHMLSTKDQRRVQFDAINEMRPHNPFSFQDKTSNVPVAHERICAARKSGPKKIPAARQGAKKAKAMERLQSAGPILDPEEATSFRALSARANYLAQDRPDIAFATKELCREFAKPSRRSYEKLKRVGRYLAGRHRLVYQYDWLESVPDCIDIYCDTDFAGCKDTRRSTSGGVAMIGGHCVKHWAKTQTTVSLSSGESELHGICAGTAQGLGLQSIARDLGFEYKIRVHSDATAAIGIARRRGMGRIRHLDCSDLWIQEKVRTKAIELLKVLGTDNPADAFTKYVDRGILTKSMNSINMKAMSGRPRAAPDTLGLL